MINSDFPVRHQIATVNNSFLEVKFIKLVASGYQLLMGTSYQLFVFFCKYPVGLTIDTFSFSCDNVPVPHAALAKF